METRTRLAVIGGSGLERLFSEGEPTVVGTPYGVSPDIYFHLLGESKVAFIARHGTDHAVPPHRINFRANITALKSLGAERILSLNAVGSLKPDIRPGDLVLAHDFIDFTKSRPSTFYEGTPVVHVDMSEPYCPQLRKMVAEVAQDQGIRLLQKGVYACTEGPRFETPAEIKLLQEVGADVVGMTGVPEVVLAREAEICYCAICIVTNLAAGMQSKLTSREVRTRMEEARSRLRLLIDASLKRIPENRDCNCGSSLKEAAV